MTDGLTAPAAGNIHARIERWRERLLELSKRNPLVNMRLGERGAVEVLHPAPREVWSRLFEGGPLSFPWKRDLLGLEPADSGDCDADDSEEESSDEQAALPAADDERPRRTRRKQVESDPLEMDLEACRRAPRFRPGHLLTSLTDKLLSRRANRLNLTARTSLSETGVNVLFLTFGVLRWFESPDSQVPLLAPLLLVPVRLARENIDSPWLLAYDDEDIATNFTIGQKIGTEFGFQWPDLPDDFDPSSSSYGEYLDRVRASVSSARRWVVEDRVGLGTFSFQKIAMWRDLGANATAIGEHGICRAIAGESRASSPGGVIDVRESDQKIKPRDLYTIRDCDSTQLEAILAAKGGVSFVLDGPPGTGKSQTITNIISEFIASGKTVLFVSEKAAALEVVKRRLDETGLGDFCLECHSHKANKKVVLAELHRCLNLEQVRYRDQREDLDRLFEMRARLTAYVRALHKPRGAVELTAYQVHGRLAEVKTRGITRCTIGGVLEIDRAGLRRRQEALAAMRPHQHILDAQERHPWRGTLLSSVSLTDEDDLRDRFTATAEAIEALRKPIEALSQLGFGSPDPAYPEIEPNLQSARSTNDAPEVPVTWFAGNPADVCNAIQRLCSGATAATEARKALSSYRSDVHEAWEGKLRGSMRALGSPALARLKRVPAVTVRGEIGRLAETLSRIDAMIRELTGLKATLSAIAELLRQPTSGTSLHGAEQIATIAEVVAGLPEVQYSWTETGTRSQLRALVDRCTPLSETVTRLRDSLEGVGCTGFDDRGAEIAVAAEHYTSFWSRLSPGWWWALRSRARALYRPNGCSRTTSELLSDLRELRLFHEHQSAVTRELEPLKRQVPVLDSPDAWFRFGTTLERLDQLRAWSADGDGLLGALGRPSGVNRQAVRRHCDALKSQIESVRSAAAVLGQSWSLEPIGVAGQLLEQSPIEDVLRALEDARGGISAARGLFVGWAGLLADKRDVPVNQIKKDAQLLDQLVAAHHGVSKTYASLKGQVPAVSDPSRHEWGTLATTARWVLDQLERSPAGVSAHIVRVVTDPDVRLRLTETLSACQRLKSAVETGYRHLSTVFPNEANVSTGVVVSALSLSALRSWLVACAADVGCLREWTEFRRALVALERLGLQELATEICERKLLITDAESAFLKRFYRAWLDAVYAQDAALKDFRFDEHEKLIDQFRSLDRAAVAGSAKRIREKLLASADRPNPSLAAPRTSELGTLLREANKKRRHLPLRQLFREIPTVLTKLKPCIMMSPLAVSTFFDSPQLRFDLVIFDEASQVRPQDAIGAIYRGKQLIVAGDQKQLPPTAFFEAAVRDDGVSEDEEEDEDDLADFESILDIGVTTGMPRKSLLWHYRSRRESLIAFSNHHIYDGDLVTFPSARDTPGSSAVTLVHVNDGKWVRSGRNARNPVEARRVAELVMEHFRDRPKQSIGVVAFSQAQQMAILAELERLRRTHPELEEFFDEERPDPFFVKNLENVQGDERNVIVVSVGYGYDAAGKFPMRFGPINKQGGERRLNVLVTRATDSVKLVASIRAHDIDLGRGKGRGVELLKYYLDYAERGVETLGLEVKEEAEGEFDSPFEAEVWRALRDLGHDVRKQIGCSGYRIDLGIVHPDRAGEFVLGIECDGATYHSSITARDRDRLRQEILEDLGWRIVRVWSTDWVQAPQRQLERITRAYELALRGGPAESASGRVRRVVEDEEPVRVAAREPVTGPSAVYESIEDVPRAVLAESVLRALKSYGSTPEEEVLRFVAQSLGFQRTGKKIRQAIELAVATLVTSGKVIRTDGRLALAGPAGK